MKSHLKEAAAVELLLLLLLLAYVAVVCPSDDMAPLCTIWPWAQNSGLRYRALTSPFHPLYYRRRLRRGASTAVWRTSSAALWLVFKNNAHHQLFVHPVILTCEERRSDVGLLGVCIEKKSHTCVISSSIYY